MRKSFLGNRFGRKTRFLGMGLFMAVGIAAMGGLVTLLWNWLMPSLFTGAMTIDYWRGLALLVLCKLLFGGGRGGHWHARRHHWDSMTPEERAHVREHFKGRWGRRFGPDGEGCGAPRSSAVAPGPHDTTPASLQGSERDAR